jgi:hypothetical protein
VPTSDKNPSFYFQRFEISMVYNKHPSGAVNRKIEEKYFCLSESVFEVTMFGRVTGIAV